MALLDPLRRLFGSGPTGSPSEAVYYGPGVSQVMGLSPDTLFRTQPHLRTVVTFIARNIAQLGLQSFERLSDNDRRRVVDDPLAMTLKRPNPQMTQYELVYSTFVDLKLNDVAIWLTVEDATQPSGWTIWPVPPSWITRTGGGSAWGPEWIEFVSPTSNGRAVVAHSDQFILFHGYRPGDPSRGTSPVEALKEVLAEQIQAWSYRQQVWQRGGRVGTVMVRPAGAPSWSAEAREKFSRDWSAKWTGIDGPKAGGTPILEDGMELKRVGFSAREDEWVEAAKLSLSTVASVYHTSPTMVGVLDNANFSNVREFKQMLYTDTLGPDLAMFEDRLNAFLVPRISKNPDLYVEFNIAEKMQGNFEEQAAVISTSVGRPWMTANEARARFNMPALDGDADQLVTPLNVLTGGQASPRDSAPKSGIVYASPAPEANAGPTLVKGDGGVHVKSASRPEDEKLASEVLRKFFVRQRAAVLSAMGAKSPDWWDQERWDGELSDDLYRLAVKVSGEVAADTLDTLGVEPDKYDEARTLKFLKAVAESRASLINSTTQSQLEAALKGDLSDDADGSTPAGVFDVAESSRAPSAGVTLATTLAAFAITEAAKQLSRPQTEKTWVVTSANPRASHAAMDGETVGIEDVFSNGLNWPGDPSEGADEVANCMCSVEITIP